MKHSHQPAETRVSTVTVKCAATGPARIGYEGDEYRQYTLADIEAWCGELRTLGAGDDLVLPDADGLTVTMGAA